jgi:basic membrane protein A
MGLAEDGVGYALDEHNKSLVSAKMISELESEKAKIVSGQIKVHDYMSDNSCPAK